MFIIFFPSSVILNTFWVGSQCPVVKGRPVYCIEMWPLVKQRSNWIHCYDRTFFDSEISKSAALFRRWWDARSVAISLISCHSINHFIVHCIWLVVGSHTAANLKTAITRIINNHSLTERVTAITTDNASNIKAACRQLSLLNISCACHTCHLVVLNAFKKVCNVVVRWVVWPYILNVM